MGPVRRGLLRPGIAGGGAWVRSCQIHPCRRARETLGDRSVSPGKPFILLASCCTDPSSFKGAFSVVRGMKISTAKVNNSKKQSARENFASL